MSRPPIYRQNKRGSFFILVLLLAAIGGLTYWCSKSFSPQPFIENSTLKERTFKGKVEEISIPEKKLKAYFIAEKDTPLVAVSFIFANSGSAYDEVGKEGLASLAAATIEYGAGRKSAAALRDEIGVKGIKFGFAADQDSFSGTMTAPKAYLNEGAEWLRKLLQRPRFEDKYVASAKEQFLKVLATEKENPATELSLVFNQKLFGEHPYGRNPKGNEASIKALQQEDLKQYVQDNFAKDNLYIGITGDLTTKEAETLMGQIFGNLRAQKKSTVLEEPSIDWQQKVTRIQRESGQNIVSFATRGTCRKCADFYPLYVANYLFGGAGLNSRLNQRIREKEGLTYGGYSGLILKDRGNLLTAGFSSTPDKYIKALNLFEEEWQKVAKQGFSAEELRMAKNYLVSSYNLRFASTIGIAEMLAYMQKYDLGLDFLQKRNAYIEKVSLQQLNQAATKYFGGAKVQAEIGTFEKGEK